jgi:flavin-binding protein dodecin
VKKSQTAAIRASSRRAAQSYHSLDERRVDNQPLKVRLNKHQHHD